jgi:hypothetical protein
MIVYALICAAILSLVWPSKKRETAPILDLDALPSEPQPVIVDETGYIESVAALQIVQIRLNDTEMLEDDQRDAINILALALTAGSTE